MVERKRYRNLRNPNKYLDVHHYSDGHYATAQFLEWDNGVKCYVACNRKYKRVLRRWRKGNLNELLKDYMEV